LVMRLLEMGGCEGDDLVMDFFNHFFSSIYLFFS